ncbi:MAG: transporter [Candidatus Hydrogenedentota bacterium]
MCALAPAAGAQQTEENLEKTDFMAMSMEELLSIPLTLTNVLGIHHAHPRGEWMVGYQYMRMDMDGNLDGSHKVSTSEVLDDYMVAPTEMSVEMHMFDFMYGVTDRLSVMAMVPYIRKSMDHATRIGSEFTTDSEGLGDIQFMALHTIRSNQRFKIHYQVGLSTPTGSIDKKGNTPAGRTRLPYPMQIGSGTVDLLPGLTILANHDDWYYGASTQSTIRLGRNDRVYSLGDVVRLDTWISRVITDNISVSFQVNGRTWGDIDGADSGLDPAIAPTANPNLRAGKRVDLIVGINFFRNEGRFKGNRISFEIGAPAYQSLDGPQLETDLHTKVGWQWAF